MSIDHSYSEQARSKVNAGTCVTRVSIHASTLLRVGLAQVLDGTRFVVSDDALKDISQLSALTDTTSILFIVDEKHCANGLPELIAELKVRHPAARVVVLADRFDFSAVMSARHAGADGFCLTTASRDVLIHSLELVMLGEVVVPSELILAIMGDNVRDAESQLGRSMGRSNDIAPQKHRLSSRETEILCWLKEGAPNKVIARKLNVAEATVKVHVKAILRKIGVGNRTQAAIWAADHLSAETTLQ
jgi:two-component system, NarL family, nitrate/nitrite response regulator NarL